MEVEAICDRLEGNRAIHPRASRGEMRHLVEIVIGLHNASGEDSSPYPSQAEMDAQDREELFRLIGWMRENRGDTRLGGENCVDWAIRLMSTRRHRTRSASDIDHDKS